MTSEIREGFDEIPRGPVIVGFLTFVRFSTEDSHTRGDYEESCSVITRIAIYYLYPENSKLEVCYSEEIIDNGKTI